MKLYDAMGPNPHTVRLFVLERGVNLYVEAVDILTLENRRAPYVTEVNTRGELPALATDDGTIITEITAICEYLDEVTEGVSLFGTVTSSLRIDPPH